MKKLHTLGPKKTDSYQAAKFYQQNHIEDSLQIELHTNFEEIYANLANYTDDYFLIPVAFCSRILGNLSFGQLHYRYLKRLKTIDSFIFALNPLICIENSAISTKKAYTHAATADLLKEICPDADEIITCASKYEAYQRYKVDGQFVLTNENNILELSKKEVIHARLPVEMIWCVYQIV